MCEESPKKYKVLGLGDLERSGCSDEMEMILVIKSLKPLSKSRHDSLESMNKIR